MATLMKSSDMERGERGRERALYLRDAAQSALEASWNSQSIDLTLAEAAMVSSPGGRVDVPSILTTRSDHRAL